MSKGEEQIAAILKKNHIKFIKEKTFKDLKKGHYRFDFFLPDTNTVIEFNGQQHYTYTKSFYKTQGEWLAALERDRSKISYCLANDIHIYIILTVTKLLNGLMQVKFRKNLA